jgi:hypothetical protein
MYNNDEKMIEFIVLFISYNTVMNNLDDSTKRRYSQRPRILLSIDNDKKMSRLKSQCSSRRMPTLVNSVNCKSMSKVN